MTLILSEREVEGLLRMDEVVASVEEAFRRQGTGEAYNSVRTRSRGPRSVLSVMHATLPYEGRGGLKAYMSSPAGSRFVLVLFDSSTSAPLAVMGADVLGRFRTGAASGVATRHLYRRSSGNLAVLGSGRQALTQALAVRSVMSVDRIAVWSPNPDHRSAFASVLNQEGFVAEPSETPAKALDGADVACSITSSREPFITDAMVGTLSHLNLAGSNVPDRAEATPSAIGKFETVVVDDLAQAKADYRDLIQAAGAGTFAWDSAAELASVVSGENKPRGRTLFKSGGAALEDVAVASMVFDKALNSGKDFPDVELV